MAPASGTAPAGLGPASPARPGVERVVAVDWSGRADTAGQRRHIWCAEAAGEALVALAGGRTRAEVVGHLERLAREHAGLVVGLDFSFSFPAWWMVERGWRDAPAAWSAAETEGEAWLARCPPPFWGRPGRAAPALDRRRPALRATEAEVVPVGGARPSSTFQIGGAGAVGTASVRGMPLLARLRSRGFGVWPFDPPGLPVVVEIYPRTFTGPVRKSDPAERRKLLARRFPDLDPALCQVAVGSEDAFDAAVSALVMAAHASELAALPHLTDRRSRTEGRVWRPSAWS